VVALPQRRRGVGAVKQPDVVAVVHRQVPRSGARIPTDAGGADLAARPVP
jgi:hypothetical protein